MSQTKSRAKSKTKSRTRPKIKCMNAHQEEVYRKRKLISERILILRKTLFELKHDQELCDAELSPVFSRSQNKLKLSDGTIIYRHLVEVAPRIVTQEMVGQTLRTGYQYPKYHEWSPE